MEIWKEIKGYEDYEVSNLGRVKSLRFNKEKILKPTLSGSEKSKYLIVSLFKGGKGKTTHIHQLVAQAFLNHKPCGYKLVIDHQNGVRTDNRLENLQVITTRKNTSKGFKNCSSKHTGVYWMKKANKWRAHIYINGKNKHLGMFINELEAAEAYVKALKELLCTK
tara:strand:- start:44 stop:538 length:495 start_codon:yes stop_codon:yes gene_type:complete